MIENCSNINKTNQNGSFWESIITILIIDKSIEKNVQGFVLIMPSISVGFPASSNYLNEL